MKIVVFGGQGFVGKRLVSQFRSSGVSVHVASSTDGTGIDPTTGLLPEDFELPAQTHAVVYLSQSPHFRTMPDRASHLLAVNALSAVRAAVAARRGGVKRFVYVSTGTVYAPSFDPLPESAALNRHNWYALSKIQAEEALLLFRSDFEVVVCRPFALYGEGQEGRLIPNLIRSVVQHREIFLNPSQPDLRDGGLRLSLCHVEDAVAALDQMTLQGGVETVNLAGNEAFSVADISLAIGRKLGVEPKLSMGTGVRDGDLISDSARFLHYFDKPMIPFEQGLDRVLADVA